MNTICLPREAVILFVLSGVLYGGYVTYFLLAILHARRINRKE
jgi:hypothetical protein